MNFKKISIMFTVLLFTILPNIIKANAATTVDPSYTLTNKPTELSVDTSIWSLIGWYENHESIPDDDEDNRDFGNMKVYVGVYHSIEQEYWGRDRYLVVYKVASYPHRDPSTNEYGLTDYIRVESSIRDEGMTDATILSHSPILEPGNEKYVISTSVSYNWSSDQVETSTSISKEIIIEDLDITPSVNETEFYMKYKYNVLRRELNGTANYHYGHMEIESTSGLLPVFVKTVVIKS